MKEFYRRNLPHWQPPEATFFVTWRLFGSIPKAVIAALKAEYELVLREDQNPVSNKRASASSILEEVPNIQNQDLQLRLQQSLRKRGYDESKRYFKKFDDFLDSNPNGPYWLRQPEIARLNVEALHFYDGKKYRLWAFCVMPNHIHALFQTLPGAPELSRIMQALKRYTGTQGNRLLNRTGRFWEEESFDHLLRTGEFERILRYILQNPVKAKFVADWHDWPWAYCHPDLL